MADAGSIGRNTVVASLSATYTQYGSAQSGGTPSVVNRSIEPRNDEVFNLAAGNPRFWSPGAPMTSLSGQTSINGTPTANLPVFVFDRNTGELLTKMISDGSGNFSLPAMGRAEVMVVATDGEDYNALIFDRVVPV